MGGGDISQLIINPKSLTERRYYYQFQSFLNSGKDFEKYIKNLDRKELSKFKNSLKLLKLKNLDYYLEICEKQKKEAKKYIKKTEDTLNIKKIEMNINRLKSKRLKLGFRLQEISGLRVAEIANLTQKDILISKSGKIKVNVINGKYGSNRTVDCFYDKWVYDELLKLKPKSNGKLFCSKEYIMNTANKLNFHTHELRKVFAHSFFYNCLESKEKTLKLLAQQMGHSDIKDCYVYINRDINTYNSKIEKVKPFCENDLTDDV